MDEQDFEGTLVLEKLASINRVDAFYEAIDSDNLQKAASLMRKASVDAETIAIVLKKLKDSAILVVCSILSLAGCSGMKVVHPNDANAKNAGTKALDFSGGVPRIVSTFSCSIVAMNGTRVTAIGNSEVDARKEAMSKCRDQTLVSTCREDNLKCVEN